MKIIWLGHGSFRFEIGGKVLLLDPWLTGNPVLPESDHAAAVEGATHILLTHAHFDHSADAVSLSKRLDVPVVGQYDLMGLWGETEDIRTLGFNKGGTVDLDGVRVAMVPASHSSTFSTPDGLKAAGSEVGFILIAEGHTLYASGDTALMADMEWIGAYYKPDIAILSAGGHFTMDMKQAAWAANRYFSLDTVIPAHYRTFPILEQSARDLIDGLDKGTVIEPQVMQAIEI